MFRVFRGQKQFSEILSLHRKVRAAHQMLDFLDGRSRIIAGGRHRQNAVRRSAVNRILQIFPVPKRVNKNRNERVAAANTV